MILKNPLLLPINLSMVIEPLKEKKSKSTFYSEKDYWPYSYWVSYELHAQVLQSQMLGDFSNSWSRNLSFFFLSDAEVKRSLCW